MVRISSWTGNCWRGLPPFRDRLKALHFEDGVNITLGLPIVRTAPDHGTAFDIAGQDRADPRAMAAAIRVAAESALHRVVVNA